MTKDDAGALRHLDDAHRLITSIMPPRCGQADRAAARRRAARARLDAGTPLVSDPGYKLAREAMEAA